LGKEIYTDCYSGGDKIQIDLSDQRDGIFFIKITIDGKQMIQKMVISK